MDFTVLLILAAFPLYLWVPYLWAELKIYITYRHRMYSY